MSQRTDEQAIEEAVQLQQAGQFAEAETIYREILARRPDCADAWHFLGLIASETGRSAMAIELIERAIAIQPGAANYRRNLCEVFRRMGDLDHAITACSRAVDLQPKSVVGLHQLARLWFAKGDELEALAALLRARDLDGNVAAIHDDIGLAFAVAGNTEKAVAAHREAVRLNPECSGFHYNLGVALVNCGRMDEAIAAHREALRLDPNSAAARLNLGASLQNDGQLENAVACYLEVVRQQPDSFKAWGNLGSALQTAGRYDEAVDACRKALWLNSNFGPAHNSLGNCHKEMASPELAMEYYHKAIACNPFAAEWTSNLVFAANFLSEGGVALNSARAWNKRHGKPLRSLRRPHLNEASPDRRLRIGYVSPDFRAHVVGASILPLLREHEATNFEVFCYGDVPQPDSITAEIQSHCGRWRNIHGIDDQTAGDQIRADEIDILVDLALHTARNRLPLFAREPAPVQVCYLGYCGTTGLDTMHYRLTDRYLDLEEGDLAHYSEQTLRLEHSYWCYEPLGPMPAVSCGSPARGEGVTFGCLNSFAKVSLEAILDWGQILKTTPRTRLLLNVPVGSCRENILRWYEHGNVPRDRIEFVSWQPWEQYVQTLARVDIALDTFPYGGGISTLDALWMGVPVVTLSGRTAVGRGGRSILSHLGLPGLIAASRERYIEIATGLAADLPRLAELRSTLRQRMEVSPLRDAEGHARAIEAAYREMWRRWCVRRETASEARPWSLANWRRCPRLEGG